MKRNKNDNGHKMTAIEVKNELAMQEKDLIKEYKGYECPCGRCGASFHISVKNYETKDQVALIRFLTDGNCPSCQRWKQDEWFSVRNMLLEITFILGDKEIKALRVPVDYRPKLILKVEPSGLIRSTK
jgi:hypothetical protein